MMEPKDPPLDSEHVESLNHGAGKTVDPEELVVEDRQAYGAAGMFFLPLLSPYSRLPRTREPVREVLLRCRFYSNGCIRLQGYFYQ